ncbi:MAG: TolC family protein, partial [Paracoccaceae bacterium]|nr:TolC family protein [Paracoccaceae bacterium]
MRILHALVIVVALSSAGVARAETLADALIAAYRNSNLLNQNRALLRATDEDVAIAQSALLPVINFTLQSTYRNTEVRSLTGANFTTDSLNSTAALNAEMSLIDFGRNRLAIEVAKETVLATREALVDVEQAVLFSAVQAFVNVRLAQSIVELRKSNV